MKSLFLFFSFVLVASLGVNAQACSKSANKSCCAKKASAAAAVNGTNDTQVASVMMEADAAVAASNGNITKKTCEISGATSYYEKSVCATSGKVSWDEVKYDADKKLFTKVASASMEKDDHGAKVETKSCAGKAEGKACCKKDGAKSCAKKEGTK